MRRREFLGILAGSACACVYRAALAQAPYPNKPVHVIVPTSAGGVHDVIARIWADRVRPAFGAIVVENRAGGGSSIGLNAVAQSPADGYTLLLGSTSTLVLREGQGNRVYDAIKDIVSAAIFATASTSIAVNPSVPVHNVAELIAYAKANPGSSTMAPPASARSPTSQLRCSSSAPAGSTCCTCPIVAWRRR